jgi:glycosyltransferase involved in cell wall biosynthesis
MSIKAQTPTLYINGKFTAQTTTGVQRTALELVRALDKVLALTTFQHVVLLCPPGGEVPELQRIVPRTIGPKPWGSLQLWEQTVLPRAASRGELLNFSGSAPWRATRRALYLLHDAAVFDHPGTYTLLFRWWYRFLFRHIARRARGMLTVSEFSRQRLCTALRTEPQRLYVVPNGSDHFERIVPDADFVRAQGLVPGRYLLVVGTDKRTKNISAVFSAWRQAGMREGQVLAWVGGVNHRVFRGRPPEHAESLVRQLGVVSDEQLKALYEHAAGLIMPSLYEGFGLPAVEAMASGCAVAVSRRASLPEVCGDAALYFDPDRPEEIVATMRTLLEDEKQREVLVQRGRQRASEFRWQRSAALVVQHMVSLGFTSVVGTNLETPAATNRPVQLPVGVTA